MKEVEKGFKGFDELKKICENWENNVGPNEQLGIALISEKSPRYTHKSSDFFINGMQKRGAYFLTRTFGVFHSFHLNFLRI